jgi:hypothetical protein
VVKLLFSQNLITGMEHDFILVITDRLTKYIYMILYFEANITKNLAYTFLRIIITNYSVPEEMISNKNKLFISRF